ncbi:hypothetical protein [Jannaschia sp. AI_61]|uniref:hypothetical protein n=1 Tax=Jannaschia sp. AI_61 TaxID=2829796 RepID=UPI001C7DC981|nr:hypothetical protein [Jannaschia sp. AI_61]
MPRLVAAMDRILLPDVARLTLSPICVAGERSSGLTDMTVDEARDIMAEIDAKSSALLSVLAILLATSAFVFSLQQTWATLVMMFAQVATISIAILLLLRCLIYEPTPRLRHMFGRAEVAQEHRLQIEAIKQVRYFNRVIVLTVITAGLFFAMSLMVGMDSVMTVPDER